MNFRHQVAYATKGITLGPSEAERAIIDDPASCLRVVLTNQSAARLAEADRYIAVANMILDGGLRDCADETFRERASAAVETARQQRERQHGTGPYVVFERDGRMLDFAPTHQRECADFAVCCDAFRREQIQGITRPQVAAGLTAVALAASELFATTKASDTVIFTRSDGKPVYSYSPSVSGRAYVSSLVPSQALDSVQDWYQAIMKSASLDRVVRLLVASLETESDPLRAFLGAWNALEILVSKSFPQYETAVFSDLTSLDRSGVRDEYWTRIREVMKDKYRLADKFVVLASRVAPQEAGADIDRFVEVKQMRDDLLHGQDVRDESLPVKAAQELARKYLRLHLAHAGRIKAPM